MNVLSRVFGILTLALAVGLIGCNGGGDKEASSSSSSSGKSGSDSSASASKAMPGSGPHAKPGFVTKVEDGRLWVFAAGGDMEMSDKHVTLIGAGPMGMTIKSPEKDVALNYLAAKDGFQTEVMDGRLWVWKAGEAKEHSDKHSTLIGAGPNGMTIKALDKDTAVQYIASKPGFVTKVEDGRLWVFKEGGDMQMSDKHSTLIGAGPMGMTVKALDKATALEYLAAKEGFVTKMEDGRLWVFKEGGDMQMSDKHVTRIGGGPVGLTVKALDKATLDAYLR